jgi:GTP diphosphokinase / guanosine-3',5'-bis(diphosphate) 3'-diphosphatase
MSVANEKPYEFISEEQENREILNAYRGLLRTCKRIRDKEDTRMIRKAFNLALDAHKHMRRKSGEPYIYHPIAVARICSEEIGLGPTAIVCALLHDTVEDTDVTLEDIQAMFGKKVARIIDGLTKMSGVFDSTSSLQAENFRKMLLTLSDDVRVIIIKLADRLHNMRTLGAMRPDKRLKIASETLYLYAPLAHRLGLYNIKSELEDLALKNKEPESFEEISNRLSKTDEVRKRFIRRFIFPLKEALMELNVGFDIKGRPKSVFSIWNKINNKNVPFEEVFDIFAIRIIYKSKLEDEKAVAWQIYSIVTDFYQPNPDRLRDWISTPKGNGYEALHTTVMSPSGKWVEVQIRSERMNEIAEKGYAAHWKYKEDANAESGLDSWLVKISEMLENPENNALDFVDDFKLNLFSDEIYVFTPNGELRTLPKGSTTLDFAFDIHTQIGEKCIGAKVNHKLVPLSHALKSGDQIEIITSKKQMPKEEWINFVVTAKAKSKIKTLLKEEKKTIADQGKIVFEKKMKQLGINLSEHNMKSILQFFKLNSEMDLYYRLAKGAITLDKIDSLELVAGKILLPKEKVKGKKKDTLEDILAGGKKDTLIIGDDLKKIDYKLSPCCDPIPGDDVFGFVTINEGIKIHRVNCPNAVQLMSNYAYRIIQARWKSQELIEFKAGIYFSGIDDVGLVNKITTVISAQLNVNMRAISFESNDGVFEGQIIVYVHDTNHLDKLINELKKIDGVHTVYRMDKS